MSNIGYVERRNGHETLSDLSFYRHGDDLHDGVELEIVNQQNIYL
jgi:hypothetical protein